VSKNTNFDGFFSTQYCRKPVEKSIENNPYFW
jgi:hypothetical protein